MTTQSPHYYQRRSRPADGGAARTGRAAEAQTRLPWWAVALPVVAFAALLALIGGGPAHASTAASGGDLFARVLASFLALVHHLL